MSTLARRAYRRPVTDADVAKPLLPSTRTRVAKAASKRASRRRSRAFWPAREFLFRVERRIRADV